jgi:acyl carrier protein
MRAPGEQISCEECTPLYGPSGTLDSLGLVSLVLDVEEAVNARTGYGLVLADERAVSQRRSPFRDVASLADHVITRLAEAEACPSGRLS